MSILDNLDRLRTQLVTSGLQKKDNPLFQVINQLIGAVRDIGRGNETAITINNTTLKNADYVVFTDESAVLPNSRVITAGTNIALDTSAPGIIEVSASGGADPDLTYLTADDETADLPNSRQLLAGTGISFDDTTPGERTINSTGGSSTVWSVLSNGDPINPEVIFVDGEVIMIHVP